MTKLFLSLLVLQLCSFLKSVSSFSAKRAPPPILACQSTSEVQAAISIFTQPNDVILELGAQLSDTSAHLCRAVGREGRAILVDVVRKEATSGRSTQRNTIPFLGDANGSLDDTEEVLGGKQNECFVDRVDYQELEQFDQWRNLYKDSRQYNVIILDLGSMIGNDLYLTTLSIATEFLANQKVPPRAIIVKSKELNNLARRIIHSQRLMDGTTTISVDLTRSTEPIIIPCVGVNDYRKTIQFVVHEGDDVLEVGCHFGTTTALLYDAVTSDDSGPSGGTSGFCAGVDIGEKIIANARKKHDGPIFEVVDAWNTLDLLKVKVKHSSAFNDAVSLGFDVVYADIGGLSGAYGLLESLALLDAISKALEPRCIVIKSQCMKRLASQLVPYSRIKHKK